MTDPYEDGPAAPLADSPQTAPTLDIPSLVLYRVDGRGRVNLSDVVADGTEFYTATKNADGTITLAPVRVATTTVKRNGTVDTDDV